MRKTKFYLTIILLLIGTSSIANANNNIIYENGVKDTLAIGTRYVKDLALISNQNSSIFLDGYGVVLNSNSLPEAKIIQATAIGLKNGLDVKYVTVKNKEFIVFSVESREADAMYLVDRLTKYGLAPTVEKLNGTYMQTVIVAGDLFRAIQDTVAYLNSKKDDTIRKLTQALESKEKNVNIDNTYEVKTPIQQKHITSANLDFKEIQVVNRVITDDFLAKYNKTVESVSPVTPNQKINKNIVDKQISTVSKNLKNDSSNIPQIDNFSKAYNYLKEHAGITKNNELILHKTVFKKGDKLFVWNITSINYNLGIIVLGNDYTVPLSKK